MRSQDLWRTTQECGRKTRLHSAYGSAFSQEVGSGGFSGFRSRRTAGQGTYRISQTWQDFIIAAYDKGKCTPAQVAIKVKNKAKAEGQDKYPSHMTVYRVLAPEIAKQEQASNIRNIGWRGSRLALKTRDGEEFVVEYCNQVWQCDHTRADVLLVDQHGELLGRPWLTTMIDTYSRSSSA